MLHGARVGVEFFNLLWDIDAKLSRAVAAERCECGGPLHVANFERKPRGALVAAAGETFTMRFGLCCGTCRTRTLPPSVRFLGRRVYFGAVVVLASVWALCGSAGAGVPRRTVRRWLGWWTTILPTLPMFAELRARFAPPPPAAATLPLSFIERLAEELGPLDPEKILVRAARLLAPVTTQSCPDASSFVRVG